MAAIRILGALMALALAAPMARGASFDCTTAVVAREKAICADPVLSAADTSLAATYRADLHHMFGDDATAFRDDERAWLKTLDPTCPPPAAKTADAGYTACLLKAYQGRLRQLGDAIEIHGPFAFRIIRRSVDTHPTGLTYPKIFVRSFVLYPQVIDPVDTSVQIWNSRMVVAPRSQSACGPHEIGGADEAINVHFATREIIMTSVRSVTVSCQAFGLRGIVTQTSPVQAHGEIVALHPAPHRITPVDMFAPGTGWQAFLARRTSADVRRFAHAKKCPDIDRLPDTLDQAGVDPKRWRFSDDGMSVAFGLGELGCGGAIAFLPAIPWSNLAPYLNPWVGVRAASGPG